jgi:hypothetical protein
MEGEKYNLAKAQEEAERLKQKVESDEVSNYGDAEKLVEQEASDSKKKILSAINQLAYKPEVVLQNNEILDDPQKFNKYLLETLFGKTQLLKSRESFEYIRDHLDEFRGVGVWPEGEIPYQVGWIFDSVADSKGSMAEVVSVLKDVYSLTEDQTKKIVVNQYAKYCDSYFNKADTILTALKEELPLDEAGSLSAAKSWLSHKIDSSIKSYVERRDGKLDISRYGTVQKNLAIESTLLDDQEIVKRGQELVRVMLLHVGYEKGKGHHPEVMPEIIRLHERAPLFFEGSFDTEIEILFNGVIDYGSFSRVEKSSYKNYTEQTFKILEIFKYNTEKTKTLFKNALIAHLSSAHVLEGLIEQYVKNTEFSELLSDEEVIQAASMGRKKALSNFVEKHGAIWDPPHSFKKISEIFGFPEDWTSNPNDAILVKTSVLNRLEKLYNVDQIKEIEVLDSNSVLMSDQEIKTAIEKAVFEDPKPWSRIGDKWIEAKNVFETWGLSLERLQEYAKQFVVDKVASTPPNERYRLFWTEKCLSAFPSILELQEVQDIVTNKILGWEYKRESYGFSGLSEIIRDIDKAVKLYKLNPELLEQWKSNVAIALLSDVKDQKQFKEFQEAQRYLKLSLDGLKNVAVHTSLAALAHGELGNAFFLEKQFSIKLSDADTEKLQRAGEAGLVSALEEGNLQNIVKIQEICHLPADFFNQPELRDKIGKLLGEQLLARGEIKDLDDKINLFRVSEGIYLIIDSSAVAHADLSSNLSRFIRYLGNEDFTKKFPQTFEHVKELIFAKLATDQDLADYFVENLAEYYQQPWVAENITKAIQQYSVAQKFVYAVENDQAVWKDEPWVADVFAKAQAVVEEHKKQWQQDEDFQQDEYGYSHGAEGFSESDQYENHPWRFGGRQIRIASAISELMAGRKTEGLKELGINSNEMSPLLAEVNEKVNTAYQDFLEQIRSNTNIKDEDKEALLNPETSSVRMISLLDNIRSFVARYFVQSIEGDVTRLSEIRNLSGELDRVLAEGFMRYIKIHEVDVPLYDKLYEEFDNLRETGRYPLEVYLGRDGIYAWIGRRAQDVARRRKMGLEGRKKLKQMGEVIEIDPQYTVYPRYFRDNLNYETKRQFLEQEGISPDADPLFYDTGYTGTIPEQIMKVMDFEQEDIERRIRLLSAPSVHRRVKGIPENARQEIIEYIEHNAKTEEAAEGLIMDEKTGKIRHIARPTNPEEQFYFMMVKQAVARHYWLQEQLHHEPSGNVNLDSEHFAIRIRQDYAKLLPQEFLSDPKEFLSKQGELLKGSKGEGEYPDEEVILFKLTDGTEIVAKRIELRKAKEARKEFAILISAKKAGLPTAEPVGFLSGKEDADGSYLLMKKLEGHSGRKFEKELTESGKYTPEKIKAIMQQVAQKNKEMAELFRTTLKIDKRWRIKDTIIEFNEETGEVESVVPIDWERAQNYNPSTPKEIDEIQ